MKWTISKVQIFMACHCVLMEDIVEAPYLHLLTNVILTDGSKQVPLNTCSFAKYENLTQEIIYKHMSTFAVRDDEHRTAHTQYHHPCYATHPT
jgi:hypothetical protein